MYLRSISRGLPGRRAGNKRGGIRSLKERMNEAVKPVRESSKRRNSRTFAGLRKNAVDRISVLGQTEMEMKSRKEILSNRWSL